MHSNQTSHAEVRTTVSLEARSKLFASVSLAGYVRPSRLAKGRAPQDEMDGGWQINIFIPEGRGTVWNSVYC